jgi:hypothetical protein
VPAAPILTAPRCFSASASLVGRKGPVAPDVNSSQKDNECHSGPSTREFRFYFVCEASGSEAAIELVSREKANSRDLSRHGFSTNL